MSIFFSVGIGGVMDSSTTFCSDFHYLSTMSVFPSLTTVSVLFTNAFLVSFKSLLVFLTLSIGVSDSLGNGEMVFDDMISVLGLLQPVNSKISY